MPTLPSRTYILLYIVFMFIASNYFTRFFDCRYFCFLYRRTRDQLVLSQVASDNCGVELKMVFRRLIFLLIPVFFTTLTHAALPAAVDGEPLPSLAPPAAPMR